MASNRTCETCRFYDARITDHLVSGPMVCRRYPQPLAKHWTDWCGEHVTKDWRSNL